MAELPGIMTGREADGFEARRDRLTSQDVPEELATRVAVLSPAYALLGIVETAEEQSLEPAQVARVHFALGERLGLPALVDRIFALPRDDKWQTMARATLRDDLYAVHQQLTAAVLSTTDAADSAAGRVAEWEDADAELVGRAAATLDEICRDEARPGPALGRPAGGADAAQPLTPLASADGCDRGQRPHDGLRGGPGGRRRLLRGR